MNVQAQNALNVVGKVAKGADFYSVRLSKRTDSLLSVRHGVLLPPETSLDHGIMVTVVSGGGLGYGATCDLSEMGIRQAAETALHWAELASQISVVNFSKIDWTHPKGEYKSQLVKSWDEVSLVDKVERLKNISTRLMASKEIVDSCANLWRFKVDNLYLTNAGGEVFQSFDYLIPGVYATAAIGDEVQTRSFGGGAYCQQGGMEILDRLGFDDSADATVADAIELATAPDCPSAKMDVILAPDQMILQIHESIGHPLELDRILGDERNYAGTSFVTLDMFGSYQYGSELLNVTFDPDIHHQVASYAFDDDGTPAQKEFIIKQGKLLRPLGGSVSQQRAGVTTGVANSRAVRWNRPAIDRMANLNVEPGDKNWDQLIGSVENGIVMKTNCSWSIDDSRNKFQFGCEFGQLIENGQLTKVVKKPNYRGVSASFWRSLAAVGDRSTMEVMGTPYCGKGEPNQAIHVGHASPACLFTNVDVFGGA